MPSYYSQTAFTLADANVSWLQVIMVVIAVAMMAGLQILFYRTRLGLAVRAVALDYRTASLMGMKVDKVTSLAFSLSGALSGFVGVLAAVYYNAVNPGMGFVAGLKGFTAAVFGGITSIPGAILGGYMLGAIENLSVQFVSSGYRDLVSYLILIIFLLFVPTGSWARRPSYKAMAMAHFFRKHRVAAGIVLALVLLGFPRAASNGTSCASPP